MNIVLAVIILPVHTGSERFLASMPPMSAGDVVELSSTVFPLGTFVLRQA